MALRYQLIRLNSQDSATASQWNELWQRGGRLPVSRFELLTIWQRHFSPSSPLTAIVVTDGQRWLAALPLAAGWSGIVPVWHLPGNDWTWSGELLWDVPEEHVSAATRALVDGVASLGRWWVWLDPVCHSAAGWQRLRSALCDRPSAHRVTQRYTIGQIRLRDDHGLLDIDRYLLSRSGNFRRQLRKMLRRAEELGGAELTLPRLDDDASVADLVQQGFAVEHQGWKGRGGTSVLCRPQVLRFFIEQAQQLARDGHLQLAFFVHRGETIAFEYGWLAKGVYYSPKVGYDERFGHLSPGQLLRHHLMEHFLSAGNCHTFDFLGPLSEATAKWATHTDPVDRLIVSNGTWCSDRALQWCSAAIPRARSLIRSVAWSR